jgi:hypothetical protein
VLEDQLSGWPEKLLANSLMFGRTKNISVPYEIITGTDRDQPDRFSQGAPRYLSRPSGVCLQIMISDRIPGIPFRITEQDLGGFFGEPRLTRKYIADT